MLKYAFMQTADSTKRKRRGVPWVLGSVVLLLLILLVLMQSSNLWKLLAVDTASDTLLLYALSSLNFFAFVIFGFILLRNILKLVRERRELQLGAKFKTRLWFYFFAVSILPIVAMAVFSSLFMNRALERWFTQIPETVVREAREVRDRTVLNQREKLRETSRMVSEALSGSAVDEERLERVRIAGNLARIEIISSAGTVVFGSGSIESTELREMIGLATRGAEDERLTDGKEYDVFVTPFSDGQRLLIAPERFEVDDVAERAGESLKEFDQLKERQQTVTQIGYSTLGVLTFLLLFASSWIAIYIARGLTGPIKALAEGADEIARGKLGHRVEVLAEDELAILVDSFNQMSATLEENSEQLQERRRYIEAVLQSISTGVISLDGENHVTTINSAARNLFRLEDADFNGIGFEKLVGGENEDRFRRLIDRARRIGRASDHLQLIAEGAQRGPAAEAVPISVSVRALPATADEIPGVVVVIEDLTELIAAQRASAWQEVARRMAHEIKNPLTPIQLSAERIARRFRKSDDIHDSVVPVSDNPEENARFIGESTSTILREVDTLKALVDEFSRFARLPEVKPELGNVNQVVMQAAGNFAGRKVSIELGLADEMPETMIDAEQLRGVFVNLIENAVEAFPEEQSEKRITIGSRVSEDGETIRIVIADNGNGIADGDYSKLFQPYFSTKGRGTGLGLAIVRRVISEHGGKIRAEGNQPKGARFLIDLPIRSS
jgi:two-component system, NtrC family, nitrogen regulation sensor histidine kinase NtrY